MLQLLPSIHTVAYQAKPGMPQIAILWLFACSALKLALHTLRCFNPFCNLVTTTLGAQSEGLVGEQLPAHSKGGSENGEAVDRLVSLSSRVAGNIETYEMTTPKGSSSGGIFLRVLSRWVMVCATDDGISGSLRALWSDGHTAVVLLLYTY